jgi:hypothetical protein
LRSLCVKLLLTFAVLLFVVSIASVPVNADSPDASIDGLILNSSIKTAIAKYGEPSCKSSIAIDKFGDSNNPEVITKSTWIWKDKGVEIDIIWENNDGSGKGKIHSITARFPFKDKTDRGVAIGTSKQAAIKMNKKYYGGKPGGSMHWETHNGTYIFIKFSYNRVAEIQFSQPY